jgi:hypothetical protein
MIKFLKKTPVSNWKNYKERIRDLKHTG